MNKKISLLTAGIIIIALAVIGGGVLAYQYFWITKETAINSPEPVPCTQEAKVCPDGSSVGRVGSNCDFAACPAAKPDETAGWKAVTNDQLGFQFKYPDGFFSANQPPKILTGDCNYSVFPSACPNINNIVIKDMADAGGDVNAIKSNLASPNYWKNPNGEKSVINNVSYCLYQTQDAATGHVFNYYYYATVKNQKCLVAYFSTSTTNCDFYLPLEPGNTEQQKNYNDCLSTNQDQPTILNQIISTFKFTAQNSTGCNTNSDCQGGASCLVEGPLIANQPVKKVCVPKGQAVPL